jgi:predicted deacylase
MLDGEIQRVDAARGTPPRLVQAPNLTDYVPCPRDAIWEPVVEVGGEVREGELVGRLHDFGDHTSLPVDIVAHRSGIIIALHFGAVVRQGATLYVIAEEVADL